MPADRHGFNFAVWISAATVAQCVPPLSGAGEQGILAPERQPLAAWRAFGTVLVSISRRPSSRNAGSTRSSGSRRSASPEPVWNGRRCVQAARSAAYVHRLDQRPAALPTHRATALGRRCRGYRPRWHRSSRQSPRGASSANGDCVVDMDVVELASHMCPAEGKLRRIVGLAGDQAAKPGISRTSICRQAMSRADASADARLCGLHLGLET